MWPELPPTFSCSSALASSTVEKKRTRRRCCSMAWTLSHGDMGLARAGAADQHHFLRSPNELAPMQLVHQGFVNLDAGEVKDSKPARSR